MPALALCLLCSLALRPPASAEAADFLPDARLQLSAARYVPEERDLDWTTWIGAGLGLVRFGSVTAFGNADVETIIGSSFRTFDANQANYHLELGARCRLGELTAAPFFHHVSRHYVDRSKRRSVDWNVLGVRLSGDAEISGRSLRFLVSLGHTTQASLPKYGWEAVAEVDARLLKAGAGTLFLRARERFVTAEPTESQPRGDFLDSLIEGGGRWDRSDRAFEGYLAFERRNDVFIEAPGARDRLLIGIRFLYQTPDAEH
jgi:hypothetical protein